MTLKEYLMDYAKPETKEIGEALIQKEIDNVPSENIRRILRERLQKIEQGERDFRF
jgi:2-iminoacetate synthase